jgi:hypothetical protein
VLCKKISSNFAILRKLATRTPVSTKRTNRVASKNHTSGRDLIFFLSDLISRGLRGKYAENSDQNLKKKILSTCWVIGYTHHHSRSKYSGQYVVKWTSTSWIHSSSKEEQVFMPISGKVEPLLLRYTNHHMQQEQVSRPLCGKVGPLLLGHTHYHRRSKSLGQYVVK